MKFRTGVSVLQAKENDIIKVDKSIYLNTFFGGRTNKRLINRYKITRNNDGHLVLRHTLDESNSPYVYYKSEVKKFLAQNCNLCQLKKFPNKEMVREITIRMRKTNNYEFTEKEKFLMNMVPKYNGEKL